MRSGSITIQQILGIMNLNPTIQTGSSGEGGKFSALLSPATSLLPWSRQRKVYTYCTLPAFICQLVCKTCTPSLQKVSLNLIIKALPSNGHFTWELTLKRHTWPWSDWAQGWKTVVPHSMVHHTLLPFTLSA